MLIRVLPGLIAGLCLLGALDGLVSGKWVQEVLCVMGFVVCLPFMAYFARGMMDDIGRWTGRK